MRVITKPAREEGRRPYLFEYLIFTVLYDLSINQKNQEAAEFALMLFKDRD